MATIYYAGPDRQPITIDENAVPDLVARGTIKPETLIWGEGMPEWQPLRIARPDLIEI